MRLVVTAEDKPAMADAVVAVMDVARQTQDEFVFGPFDEEALLSTGLEVSGSVDTVLKQLRHLPKLHITVEP